MLVYTGSDKRTVNATWARRRNNIDIYLDAFDTASHFVWTRLKAAHEKYQTGKAVRSSRHLDDRTLSDIGMSRGDLGRMAHGPEAEPEVELCKCLPGSDGKIYDNRLFDGMAS